MKTKKHNGGEISFGLEVLLFVVVIFIIWIFMGGAKKKVEEKPFITPLSNQVNPGMKYGPKDIQNQGLNILNKAIPQATETFKDSFLPYIGMLAIISHLSKIFLSRPKTSGPKIIATFCNNFILR